MSRTKRSILLVALSLIFISMCSICAFTYLDKDVSQGKSIDFGSKTLNEYYAVNDTITVPGTVDILDDGGVKIENANVVSAVLYAPDGSVNNAGQEFTLDQVGIYTVRYYYEIEGVREYIEHEFTVAKNKYYTSSESSSVEYISNLEDTSNSQTYKFREYYYGDNGKGNQNRVENGVEINDALRVTLTDVDTFTYSKPIKLNAMGKTNLVTFTNFIGLQDREPIMASDGVTPLYDLYELEKYPQDYYEHTVEADGTITWAEGTDGPNGDRKWKEGIVIPYMYKENEKVKYTIDFKITDAYDEDNYIVLRQTYSKDKSMLNKMTNTYDYYNQTYASFNGTAFKGLAGATDRADRPKVYYNNTKYDVHCTSTSDKVLYRIYQGTPVAGQYNLYQLNQDNTRVAYNGNSITSDNPWYQEGEVLYAQKRCYTTFQYDAEKNNVYWCTNGIDTCYSTLIMNLDLAEVYGGKTFSGFSSDEVFLSCTVRDFSTSTITTDIVDIGGHNVDPTDTSFETVGESAAIKYDIDDTDPYLEVNYTPSYNGVVYAAQDCAFPIFDYVARDVNFKGVSTEVYYNYVDQDNKGTLIYSNGKSFTPRQSGRYTIEYTAWDTFGNSTVRTVDVLCINTPESELITLNIAQSEFDALTIKAGITVNLPTLQGKYSGLNGDVNCSVKAVYLATGEEIAIENDAFTPLYAGAWKIVYTLEDIIMTDVREFNVTVGSSNVIGVEGAPTLPKYLIANAKYSLEEFNFFTFADAEGRTSVASDIKISYDNGVTFEEFHDGDTIKNKDTAIIRYYKESTNIDSAPIKIIDVNFGENTNNSNPAKDDDPSTPDVDEEYGWRIERYFYGEDFNTFTTKYGTVLQSKVSSGSATFEFIKELSATNFSFAFRSLSDDSNTEDVNEATGTNFGALNITLTDYYNPSNKIVINLKLVDAENAQLIVDGKPASNTTPTILRDTATELRYDSDTKAFVLGKDSDAAQVLYTLPFAADKVYVSFEMTGITGDAGICITKVMGQNFRTLTNEKAAPMNYISYEKGTKALGDIFSITVPYVTDTFTPILKSDIKVTVQSPSKGSVMTVDGVDVSTSTVLTKAMQIELTEHGRYIVMYNYQDQFGNAAEVAINVDVVEKEPPTITFNDGAQCGVTVTAKVGLPVVLKEATAVDNVDENPRLTVLVMDMNLNLDIIKLNTDGQRVYTPLYKGLYRVSYRAVDATGNSNIIYYYIDVQ